MRSRRAFLAVLAGVSALGVSVTRGDDLVGPDLIAGDIQSTRLWEKGAVETAYSLGRTACNLGEVAADWLATPNSSHPLSAMNMFRLSAGGVMEQLGYGWVFHHVCALQQDACGECDGGAGCQPVLHAGCSNPNTASRGGAQGGLAPKWQVNPHTVEFALPWHPGEGNDGPFRKRLRVDNDDLDPFKNPDVRYFVEVQYLAKDDAAVGRQNNNASYREVSVNAISFALSFVEGTQREHAAILAWQDSDPLVTAVDVQVDADGERDPETNRFDDGRFIVAYKVTDLGGGTWRYEYAIQNLNSHRAARVFAVPVPANVDVIDIGFHDVDYHSGDGIAGENFDGTDWPATVADGVIAWSTDTLEMNENANALRWGTLYNFRFTADAPPAPVTGRLEMFRSGDPAYMAVALLGPNACPGDLDLSGAIDFADLLAVLAAWGDCPPPPACPADLDGSGAVTFADLLTLLAAWGPCGS